MEKALFDPGYSKFAVDFPYEFLSYVDEIKKIKANHARKFEFTKLENISAGFISKIAGVYCGCILWGFYLSNNFKNEPAQIDGNPALKLDEKAVQALNYGDEPRLILEFIEKMDASAKFYLGRPYKITENERLAIKNYLEFVTINDSFKTTKTTAEIKIIETLAEKTPTQSDLNRLKESIQTIIKSDSITKIFEVNA